MTAAAELRHRIDAARRRLRAEMPANQDAALFALVRAREQRGGAVHSPGATNAGRAFTLITGRPLADLGGNLALGFCLSDGPDGNECDPPAGTGDLAEWATALLNACDHLAAAELTLALADAGFMRLVSGGDDEFTAWIATSRTPAAWWERADYDWWGAWLTGSPDLNEAAARTPLGAKSGAAGERQREAAALVATMAYQFPYPREAVIGGVPVRSYRTVLASLIARVWSAPDPDETSAPQPAAALIAAIAAETGIAAAEVAAAVAGFTLSEAGAGYHAAVPGIAAAPLVAVAAGRLIWSRRGLTTEPLLFLGRELRRRDAESYHNAAHQREALFRDDLYALFADKRFVTSPGRIELRWADGKARTDLDAVVFDRKSGTLGLFELKSQEPFARSRAERIRQRDNVLHANQQIAGALDWLQRHRADDVLGRVDGPTAKRFRVQKVYPFVLGRYLAHFPDGSPPDRRAAWGTWPQLLRLRAGAPFGPREANPLASLFTRLSKDEPPIRPPAAAPADVIHIGDARLTVHASFAAAQAGWSGRGVEIPR